MGQAPATAFAVLAGVRHSRFLKGGPISIARSVVNVTARGHPSERGVTRGVISSPGLTMRPALNRLADPAKTAYSRFLAVCLRKGGTI